MKKTKRVLSLITSLAITTSAFTGFAIQANAAEAPIVSYDFESGTSWTVAGDHADRFVASVISDETLNSKVQQILLETQTGGRKTTMALPEVVSGEGVVKIDFDWYSGTGGANNSSDMILRDSSNREIFKLSDVVSSKAIVFNDAIVNSSAGTALPNFAWYNVSAVLDFDTHKVLSISFTPVGEDVPAATFKGVEFINKEASDMANFYLVCNRKTNINLDLRLDDVNVSKITDEYRKVTLQVNDELGAPLSEATVELDGQTYLTDSEGKFETKLEDGEYTLTVSKVSYEGEKGTGEPATVEISVSGSDIEKTVTLHKISYEAVPTTVTLSEGQKVMTAPSVLESLSSSAYSLEVLDQQGLPIEDAEINWSIAPEDENVTVENGIVTVKKGFDAGETNVKDFTVTANASKNGGSKAAEAQISISDYLFYEPGVDGSSYGETESHAVGDVNYITTGSTKDSEATITLPEPIKFAAGTAQLLSFETAMTSKEVYTFQRSVIFASSDDNNILTLDYVNKDIGKDAAWSTSNSTLGTKLGAVSGIGAWQKVSILFKTNSSDITKAVVTIGDQETELGEVTADDLAKIKLKVGNCGGGTDRYVALKDIVVENVDVTGIGIEGPEQFSIVSDKTITKDYSVDAMVVQDSETFNWETNIPGAKITTASDNTEKVSLSVPGTTADGNYTITVTSSESSAEAPKTAKIDVKIEAAKIQSANLNGTTTINNNKGETAQYSVSDVIDQFGDDVTDYFAPVWSVDGVDIPETGVTFNVNAKEAGTAVILKAVYNSNGTLASLAPAETVELKAGDNEINVTASNGTKVMIWDSLDGMNPLAEAQTVSANIPDDVVAVINSSTGLLTVNNAGVATVVATLGTFKVEKDVTIADFSKVVENPVAGDIDVSDVVSYGATTYTVTLADGSTFVKTASDNKIYLTAEEIKDSAKLEVVPNYKFNLGNSTVDGYVTSNAVKENGYGFASAPKVVTSSFDGVKADGVALDSNSFEIDLPDGRYDMTFSKADTVRTHIRMNGLYTIPEADYTDGDGSDPITVPGTYTQKDVIVEGGVAVITADEWGKGSPAIASVEVTKKSDMEERQTHIWIAGDSTVTNYRPTPTKDDWEAGKRRTGWGQLFEYYLQDSVIVDDYAHSGDYSTQWYNNTFPSVIQKAQPGDYLLIQFGINDRADKNNTPTELMEEILGKMVDECRAKGVIPVLMTPEICMSQYGDVAEHVQSTGSGNAPWFNTNKTVSKEKDVLLIDLADLSGKLWAEVGRTWVQKNYFLYDNSTDTSVDGQHMSYQGAKLVAQLVATSIYDQIEAGTKTANGESFAGIPVNVKSQANITYTDATDSQEKTVERTAVTFSLDKNVDGAF